MKPLAELLRPSNINEYVGQEHLLGPNAILRKAIEHGNIPSMIFWGPPGVGKTTLALIIAHHLNKPFFSLSAVNSGVHDIRKVIEKAKDEYGHAILFIDEIHRFSKSQQDSLLHSVEKGIITLIGATTENPSFEVIAPLLSRCQVYVMKAFSEKEMKTFLQKATDYYKTHENIDVQITQYEAFFNISSGDARRLINAVELIVKNNPQNKVIKISNDDVYDIVQKNITRYDKDGEQHYDIISAFIKSMRGSDPNAALYWMARMIQAGEDPKFIARRMLIFAAEDIGNANPNALLLAQTTFDAVHVTGYPECRIILSQTAIYLATSVKSNAAYVAIENALKIAKQYGDLPVPLHLRNAPTKLMKNLNYGKQYKYPHDFEGNFIHQNYLPHEIKGKLIYEPGENVKEKSIRQLLQQLWKNIYKY